MYSRLHFTVPLSWSSYLQISKDLGAFKHEDVVAEISQSRLPGDVVSLLVQVFGCSQGQRGVHYFGSVQ